MAGREHTRRERNPRKVKVSRPGLLLLISLADHGYILYFTVGRDMPLN